MTPPQSAEKSLQEIRDLLRLVEALTRNIEGGTPPTPYFSGANFDAFERFRVSEPQTVIDTKLLHDKVPLLYDEAITDTSGNATSTHDPTAASVTMHVETDDVIIRQTRTHYNYQPGKSQVVILTGNLGPGGAGVTVRFGAFTATNGLFFECVAGVLGVVKRNNSADTRVVQSAWNLDTLDGSGDGNNPSGLSLDVSKAQIFVIDYEWLSLGRVRFGFFFSGTIIYVHEFAHVNELDGPYMATPNQPIRYEIRSTDATSEAIQICSTIMSEGGQQDFGIITTPSATDGTALAAATSGTIYALAGIRLKSTHLDAVVRPLGISILNTAAQDYQWMMLFNPTIAGAAPSWAGVSNSAVEQSQGVAANTIADDAWEARLASGFVKSANQGAGEFTGAAQTAIALGSLIDETPDQFWLAVRPLANGASIEGSITVRELL